VWTTNYWFITYAFYHPRDYAGNSGPCCSGSSSPLILPGDNHENDLEGAIVVVTRADGLVQGIATIAHFDLHVYDIPPSPTTPAIMIDNGTHAVEMVNSFPFQCISSAGNPCDDCIPIISPHIIYTLGTGSPFVSALPSSQDDKYLSGIGSYNLVDIFGSSATSLYNLKSDVNVFDGSNFFMRDGDTDCQQYGGQASAPWGWSQMKYDWWDLNGLIFDLSLPSGSAFVNVLHNPYFNECTDAVNFTGPNDPNEEISYVRPYSQFEILPFNPH